MKIVQRKKHILLFFISMLTMNSMETKNNIFVHKKKLANGLTILVRPNTSSQKVSVHIGYPVGSKHEESGERGLAHLLEHMIFKGTDLLSETDIPLITHKLSGKCNAYTSCDATMYHFDFPVQQWQEALPIMANCMQQCTLKQDLLNAEFKAVLQEMKMRADNYPLQLLEKITASIFEDHPYHYPIIGYKQDLWSVTDENLKRFYKKHYVPNNAVLVIVGNVDPQEAFSAAESYFSGIPADPTIRKQDFYYNQDFSTQSIKIYRDVRNHQVVATFVIPGADTDNQYISEILEKILTGGKSSRLYKRLIDEEQLATYVSSFTLGRFDHDLFCIRFDPKDATRIDAIYAIVQQELDSLAKNGSTEQELQRATKQVQSELYELLENNYDQSYLIAKWYLATGNENYIYTYIIKDAGELSSRLKDFVTKYLRSSTMHTGIVVPLPEEEKSRWLERQKKSDQDDAAFLAVRQRISEVEEPSYASHVVAKEPNELVAIVPEATTLANGLKVLSYARHEVPKVEIALRLKADNDYTPDTKIGLYSLLCAMMREGTVHYSASALAQELESRGMELSILPGSISLSMLAQDVEKGLELLQEILMNCTFPEAALEKVKAIAFADYQRFLDSPGAQAHDLIRKHIYAGHPWSKCPIPNPETIAAITVDDLKSFYKHVITPHETTIAIVGDIDTNILMPMMEKTLGIWKGNKLEEILYPSLPVISRKEIVLPMARDQVVLAFAGSSIDRLHPDFDSLLLFERIFSHGMSSRLFALRMKYGIFYTINGYLAKDAAKQPGMILIMTIVSPDRVKEAEDLLNAAITSVVDTITQEELDHAKNIIFNIPADAYSTNTSIAYTLLFLDMFKLPYDYFEKRSDAVRAITLDQVKKAVSTYLRPESLAVFKVGRVTQNKE